MAWIKSHQTLLSHPKTFRFAELLGLDIDQAIGKLTRLWWWCLDYAPDGNLERFTPATLARAMGLDPERGDELMSALIGCGQNSHPGFVDEKPYRRIHDWLEYASQYLRDTEYKHNPKEYLRICKSYQTKRKTSAENLRTNPRQSTVEERRGEEIRGDKNKDIASTSDSIKEVSKSRATNKSELIAYCVGVGLTSRDGEYLWEHWEENGWTRGNKPIRDWRSNVRKWKLAGWFPSQKQPAISKFKSPLQQSSAPNYPPALPYVEPTPFRAETKQEIEAALSMLSKKFRVAK